MPLADQLPGTGFAVPVDSVGMRRFLLVWSLSLGASALFASEPFAPLTPEQLALRAVPAHPGTPAVVLDKHARLRLRDDAVHLASTLEVTVRLKVLSEAGKAFGQIAVGHGRGVTLEAFEGRTVQPDGRVVALPEDAVFHEQRQLGRAVTKAAFPAVEVGSILDYRFRLRWRARRLHEPWTLDDRVPTVRASLDYVEPAGWRVGHVVLGPPGSVVPREEVVTTSEGRVVRVLFDDLPPVVEEPYGLAFRDLSHSVLVLPERVLDVERGTVVPQLDSWRTVCDTAQTIYDRVRKFGRQVKRLARERTRGLRGDRDRAEALYRLVRDEVETPLGGGLLPVDGASLDRALENGRADHVVGALLLEAMLDAVKIDAELVWAADWREGRPDLDVVHLGWFEKVLVRVELHDGAYLLDPSDRRLPFGVLSPLQEGTEALVVDRRSPRVVALPVRPAGENLRHAELDMALDTDGRLAAEGTLALHGHHAWFYLRRRESDAAIAAGWHQWLGARLPRFAIDDSVAVTEDVQRQQVVVRWSMRQHESEVLGDEASLATSRPLGPIEQRYTISRDARRTPVRVSFPDRDELVLRLRWPEGWQLDAQPEHVATSTELGGIEAEITADVGGRALTYTRTVELRTSIVAPGAAYGALRSLYRTIERHDAQSLVLLRD